MDLARVGGLDEVRAHLTDQYVSMRDPDKARPDVVDSVCVWLGNLMSQYSGMVDETTGAPLAWWQARQKMASQQPKPDDTPRRWQQELAMESIGELIRDQMPESQAEDPFRILMILLIHRSCNRWQDEYGEWHAKLTLEGRSVQCYEWARHYDERNPELAEELRYQAKTYARMRLEEQEKEARDART